MNTFTVMRACDRRELKIEIQYKNKNIEAIRLIVGIVRTDYLGICGFIVAVAAAVVFCPKGRFTFSIDTILSALVPAP